MVKCEGVPRDLGRDQGVAFATAIRAVAAGSALRRLSDRLGGEGRATRRWLRDVRRHFPHQGEWIEGLARAAGVPEFALVRAMRATLRIDASAIALASVGSGGVRIARTTVPGSALRYGRDDMRKFRPSNGAHALNPIH